MAANHSSWNISISLHFQMAISYFERMDCDKIDDAVLGLLYLVHWLEGLDITAKT